MSKETARSEETKNDGLNPHEGKKSSVEDQGKVSDDENQLPDEAAQDVASDEDPEALATQEKKAGADDDDTAIESSPKITSTDAGEGQEKTIQEEIPSVDEPEKLAEEVLEGVAEAGLATEEKPAVPTHGESIDETRTETASDVTDDSITPVPADKEIEGKAIEGLEEMNGKKEETPSAPVSGPGHEQPAAEDLPDEPEGPFTGRSTEGEQAVEGFEEMGGGKEETPSAPVSGPGQEQPTSENLPEEPEGPFIAPGTKQVPAEGGSEEKEVVNEETPTESTPDAEHTQPTAEKLSGEQDKPVAPATEQVGEGESVGEVPEEKVGRIDETETAPAPKLDAGHEQPTTEVEKEGSEGPVQSVTEGADKGKGDAGEPVEGQETSVTSGSKEETTEVKDGAADSGVEKGPAQEEIAHSENEDDIHDDGDELVHADYSQYNKEELVATIKKLTKIDDFKKLDLVLNRIDPLFQKIKSEDRKLALEKYIAEGGSEEDFAYKNGLDQKYDAYFKLIKERKHKFYGDLGRQKLENYQKATELLEKLRHLVDGEESTTSINAIKEVQEEWKAIGQVPPQHVRNLWASYNALMDRFYDNRSIYFELKELDRRKNLVAKEELCVRAEKLEGVSNLKDAIKELNELHNEYKHIGPVPKSQQEALWQRFKAASDKVYARRKTYYDDLKKDLEVNFDAKAKLRDEVQPFAEFDSDRIVEWNKKTQEILDIQKRWEAIGGLPRDRAHEVNKPFWSAFKRFFNNKNGFFKKLEGQREGNLKLKEELVTIANTLKDSTDWNQTANELKKLQNDWRNIGPVPEKHRNEVYQRFKQACDHFFENRRNRFKAVEKEYEKNLELKEDVCQRILKLAEEGEGDIGKLEALQEEWNSIGFVPKNAIRSSQEMFAKAVDKFIANSSLDEDEKNKLKITTKLTSLKGTPNANRKLNKKEFTLRRQITNLENDISLWKNNLEFFANSKNADQVREEFDGKIENAKKQLTALKAQLKIIRDI